MSATEIPSGRGRLRMPGMGQTLGEPSPEPVTTPPADTNDEATTPTPVTTAQPQPARPRPRRRTPSQNGATADAKTPATAVAPKRNAKGIDGPYAGEKKAQVNPRIYPSIWTYYEDLVEELPRHQRHGALTALVNAVLAQHAPADAEVALDAIQWLRQAEARERPA